jgi:23S rRNA (uracil1939-C5)-methyltransferase
MSAESGAAAQHEGRVECVHGDRCGGCALLGRSRAEQAEHKREAVRAALAGYGWLSGIELAEVAAPDAIVAYRTRAKLVVSSVGAVGLYARGSHDVVDIPHCRVLSPAVAQVVAALRALLSEAEHAALRASGGLAGIDVREVVDEGEAGALVTLIGEPRVRAQLQRFAEQVMRVPNVRSVALSARERNAPALLGAMPELLHGPAASRDRLSAAMPYQLVAHGGFAQGHRAQAATLARRVRDGLIEQLGELRGKRVLELYAGSGALALWLGAEGAQLHLVERYAPAVALVASAAREQGLPVPDARIDDATRALADLRAQRARFDAVIVNPPRTGLPAALRSELAALGPRAIAYVSCEPRTLARDLSHLAALGYAATRLEPFDMLPLSASVECFALLRPAPRPELNVLYEDDTLLVVDKPPFVATTPQGERTSSLLDWAQRQRGLNDLAAVHRLDAGTSGVCLLAKRRAAIAGWSAALRDGEKQYLALARGITHGKGNIRRPLLENGVQHQAHTRYQRVQVLGGHSLLRVRPEQGRKHQVRRHLAGIGHPLLGDSRHGDAASNRFLEHRHGLDRPFLHLSAVTLVHPVSGQTLVLEAPLAADLEAVSTSLRE